MVKNGQKWSKSTKLSKIVQNGSKWSQMVQNGEKWSKWSKQSKMVEMAKNGQNCQIWSKWSKMEIVCSENNTQQSEEVPLTMLPMYGSTPSQTTLILTINMFRLDCRAFRLEKFSIKFGLSEEVKICAPKR